MTLGMTYMYNGRKELGLELARRCMNDLICEQGTTWDQPNIVRGNTGQRRFGANYYQNMMLCRCRRPSTARAWSIPASPAAWSPNDQGIAARCRRPVSGPADWVSVAPEKVTVCAAVGTQSP